MIPLIRPARLDDLPHLLRFSKVRASGITSLPENEKLLAQNLDHSQASFANGGDPLEEALYVFCLQYGKRVIGVSAIKTAIGKSSPFFMYHLTSQMQKCTHLNLKYELEILDFQTINSLPTEIGSLFLERTHRKKHFGRLLSYARFLLMANFPTHFSTVILAQLRGVNTNGHSPFWDAVGNKFFGVTFDQAEHLRADHPDIVAELFPRSRIYPAMLPKKAQDVIRVPHKNTVPARLLLEKEGFQISPYCDIFDAGPHMYAARDSIKAVKDSKVKKLRIQPLINKLDNCLVANTHLDFRATIAPVQVLDDEIMLQKEIATLLEVEEGESVRYLEL
ncbi:MAG: arginine N-succinyltransferase [Chlamydiales bacterium]|nr:arginine N-succinyltransferase [Chlamydiales bacterium]